jgi:hypothetical protein
MIRMLIGRAQAALRFARGRRRVFRVAEDSDRRRGLDAGWDDAFGGCAPDGGALRSRFPERWARFHVRGDGDDAPDAEAAVTLRTLLDDLRGEGDRPLRVFVEEYGATDLYGGWSRSLPIDFFPWRRESPERRGPTLFSWASDPGVQPAALDAVLRSAVEERGYAIIADDQNKWAFCPYYAGVDVIFASTEERDEFVARHRALLPPKHPASDPPRVSAEVPRCGVSRPPVTPSRGTSPRQVAFQRSR